MSSGAFKNVTNRLFAHKSYIHKCVCVYVCVCCVCMCVCVCANKIKH